MTSSGSSRRCSGGKYSQVARRHVVSIAELAVSNVAGDQIVTHALGSCIAVCIWDGESGVGGLLHFLLPDSAVDPQRAVQQPGTFADTGLESLFNHAYAVGLAKRRCRVRLVGGAEMRGRDRSSTFPVGYRNILAARSILWRLGLLIEGEATGGAVPRTVTFDLADGRVAVTSAGSAVEEL